jgi:hypothetical protein
MPGPTLSLVPDPTSDADGVPATAVRFAEAVRTVGALARRGGLDVPAFRSPPRRDGVDRTIRRRSGHVPVVAIRLDGRPLAAVHADVIDAVAVANELEGERADRFRRAAWRAVEGPGASAPDGHRPRPARPGPARVA